MTILSMTKYLKYPGKYEKYVEFNIFQKFVMMYRDELISSLDNDNQTVQTPKKEQIKQPEVTQVTPEVQTAILEEEKPHIESDDKTLPLLSEEELEEANDKKDKDTNWTQLLLGKLR